jgi:hypothetical protein
MCLHLSVYCNPDHAMHAYKHALRMRRTCTTHGKFIRTFVIFCNALAFLYSNFGAYAFMCSLHLEQYTLCDIVAYMEVSCFWRALYKHNTLLNSIKYFCIGLYHTPIKLPTFLNDVNLISLFVYKTMHILTGKYKKSVYNFHWFKSPSKVIIAVVIDVLKCNIDLTASEQW